MKFQGSIIGRLTTDPKIKDNMTYFTVAVNRKRNGKETTDFINCFAYGNNAKAAQDYLKKGHLVDLFGEQTLNIYNDKAQANLSVDRLTLIQPRENTATPPKSETPAPVKSPERAQPERKPARPTPPPVVEEDEVSDENEDDDNYIPF